MLNVLDLFSGIGGFSLGLERTGGFQTVAFCEIDPYCQKVLARHWPNVPCHDDVRTLTAQRLRSDYAATVDVVCGGFPCQDISIAGRRAGMGEGTRSGLWSEIMRLVLELRPKYVILENVTNLLSGPNERPGAWFGEILGGLAEGGYDAEWEVIPASSFNAAHPRERVWIVAYPNGAGFLRWPTSEDCKFGGAGGQEQFTRLHEHTIRVAVPARLHGRIHDGVSGRVDRLKSLGNAVFPPITEFIGNVILATEAAANPTPAW